jgi:acyl dehydratase
MSLPELDRGLIGQEFDRVVSPPITAEEIIRFARAYGETDPKYIDEERAKSGPYRGLVAPPLFAVSLRRERFMPASIPIKVIYRGMDAGKDVEVGVPIRPGDVLTSVATVHDIYEKTGRSGAMMFLVFRTVVTNQRGETAAIIDQRMLFK